MRFHVALFPMGALSLVGVAGAQTRIVRADVPRTTGLHFTVPFRCIGAGRANEGLRADWRQQLATVQRELGFDYFRMHDEMALSSGAWHSSPVCLTSWFDS